MGRGIFPRKLYWRRSAGPVFFRALACPELLLLFLAALCEHPLLHMYALPSQAKTLKIQVINQFSLLEIVPLEYLSQ